MGVRLVGIGTDYGAAEFAATGYFTGDFLVSRDYEIYKRIKGIKQQSLGGLSFFWSGNVRKMARSYSTLKAELGETEYNAVAGNLKGSDPFLGATFVIGPGNVLHFAHFQAYAGDHPSNDDVLAAVKAAMAGSSNL
eukprot:TRINITY_DN1452_c0_g1_i1.p2 TRINITY_DN1452_c0_g1~~TRINITY_DN1452_c0_g1_i1.p2  ORF type:complete len:136 (+),score=50.49 TRINITY_DN1452_c0_g1_i1:592-999(+)